MHLNVYIILYYYPKVPMTFKKHEMHSGQILITFVQKESASAKNNSIKIFERF